ncbi:MAG TPA: ABC transporter ATP-binding protein [Chloroflexota bacterium]|nr:ABC transporter ATP-binding protein [Chloroflexota bacterium]
MREVDLEVGPGVIGLLGPNGAGKSTLMRLLATIAKPTDGSILWNGTDIVRSPDTLRAVLGYLPQDFGVYPRLTAIEFLEYIAAIKGIAGRPARRRIDELLTIVNLTGAARRPLGSYSGGMKQRVGIAQALLNDPRLLIVDEPTAGLDPEERVRFRALLSGLARDRIIFLSTHIVSDVEAAATDIVVLHKGRKVLNATPEKLLRLVAGRVWQWVVPSEALPALKKTHLITGAVRRPDGVHVRVVSDAAPAAEAGPIPPCLEDAYLSLVAGAGAGGGAGTGTGTGQ